MPQALVPCRPLPCDWAGAAWAALASASGMRVAVIVHTPSFNASQQGIDHHAPVAPQDGATGAAAERSPIVELVNPRCLRA